MPISDKNIKFKGYCWSLGTTSFRTRFFNYSIEKQLGLLRNFWSITENQDWGSNDVQVAYYDYLLTNGFIVGDAARKDKDAREKTSGLVDIGLLDDNRHITQAGEKLLRICDTNSFGMDNFLKIPNDSYLFLKQMFKVSVEVDKQVVRPFVVLIHLLCNLDFLSDDEFTYLLPLCINSETTEFVIDSINAIRSGETDINAVIEQVLLSKANYKSAYSYFMKNEVSEESVCIVGLNRKSRNYDKPYFYLYECLKEVYLQKKFAKVSNLYDATTRINIGVHWRTLLFEIARKNVVEEDREGALKLNIFSNIKSEDELKTAFFKTVHLLKAKATLSDYADLNRRYIKTTSVVLFENGICKLDLIPRYFFKSADDELYGQAYDECDLLNEDCELEDISNALKYNEPRILDDLRNGLNVAISSIEDAYDLIEQNKYDRFNAIIDEKFPKDVLVQLLSYFEDRRDGEINAMVTDNADIPTIFEYILGVVWYRISGKSGDILKFMKLSLDADLLPVTHAAGGDADIIYEYSRSAVYPSHALLLEATLAERTNQRRMEMEPVSRHLGNYILANNGKVAYCIFVTTYLHPQVICDLRGRKQMFFCDGQNPDNYIYGMKIIPITTTDLRKVIECGLTYNDLYDRFDKAYNKSSDMHPFTWYKTCVEIQCESKPPVHSRTEEGEVIPYRV